MDDFRSKSCGHGKMELESYYGYGSFGSSNNGPSAGGGGGGPNSSAINGMQDLRCYSASYAKTQMGNTNNNEFKKVKSANNGSISKSWSFSDPELQRKKRVAGYKVYTVEGKLKGSLRKSFRWIKQTCDRVVYGR